MIGFFTGIWGKLAAGGLILLAVLAAVLKVLSGAKRAGYDKKEAEDAKAREAHIERIQDAKRAGEHVDPGGVYDDPYNRTRTKGPGRS